MFKTGLSFGMPKFGQNATVREPTATPVTEPEAPKKESKTQPGKNNNNNNNKKNKIAMPVSDSPIKKKQKRTKKSNGQGKWNLSIYRIFKALRDGEGVDATPHKVQMTKKVLAVLNGITDDLSEELLRQASKAKSSTSRKTLQVKDILLATHLIFPNAVGIHAADMGTKAIKRIASK